MEPHSIPRQITTFEFKLIGFLTLKQFIYLLFTTGITIVFYYGVPIPILNVFLAALVVAGGLALAFLPINERPMDVWIKNFFKKLMSASQYYYIKKNSAPDFLMDVFVTKDPRMIENHIDAQKKLHQYLQTTSSVSKVSVPNSVPLENIPSIEPTFPPQNEAATTQEILEPIGQTKEQTPSQEITQSSLPTPFIWGIIKNNQDFPLPNILVYIKDRENKNLRILKSNIKGIYATFSPLPLGEYYFEIRDPTDKYFFDTMKLSVQNTSQQVFNFKSKELL